MFGALPHLVIVELVPFASVESVCCVVAGAKLTLMVRDGEEIVEGAIRRALPTHHEFRHI